VRAEYQRETGLWKEVGIVVLSQLKTTSVEVKKRRKSTGGELKRGTDGARGEGLDFYNSTNTERGEKKRRMHRNGWGW